MFTTLKIKNFKSHVDTILNFCTGINVIVGGNRVGKTNILRALNLVINNRPSGFNYLYKKANKKTKVEIELSLSDDAKVTFRNSKQEKSVYELEINKKKLEFTGVGVNVPDKVQEVLNIGDINIQSQLDQPFLATSTGGEIAKIINRILKTEKVDDWISSLTSEINFLNRSIDKDKKELEEVNIKLDRYKEFDSILLFYEDLLKLENKIDRLNAYYSELENLIYGIVEIEDNLGKLKKFDIDATLFDEVDSIDKEVLNLNNSWIEISNTSNNIINYVKDIKFKMEEIESLREQYISLLKKDGECPTCFTKIDSSKIKEIIKEI